MSAIRVNPAPRRQFFTPRSLGEYLAISERTVRQMLADGDIMSYTVGGSRRVDPAVNLARAKRVKPRPTSVAVKPQPRSAEDRGHIYFIGAAEGHSPIKVGWTAQVSVRVADLQIGNSETLICHGSLPGTGNDENRIHKQLNAHRVRGEWFERDAALALLNKARGRA